MIKILNYTKNPLTTMGEVSGICYGTTNPKRFRKIAERCLKEGHGRISEFADITIEISGYSAKLIREIYTHISGTSRVQASTRYIDYSKQFEYVTPHSIEKKDDANKVWIECMEKIQDTMSKLKELDIPTEDYTNVLPLAYSSKMVLKINVRALIHMFNLRLCTCAYWEYREFMVELKKLLSELDEEWKFLSDSYFVSKCVASGFCTEETRHCGVRPLKKEVTGDR